MGAFLEASKKHGSNSAGKQQKQIKNHKSQLKRVFPIPNPNAEGDENFEPWEFKIEDSNSKNKTLMRKHILGKENKKKNNHPARWLNANIISLTQLNAKCKCWCLSRGSKCRTKKRVRAVPAVSQSPRFTVCPSTLTLALKLSKTVGT